MAVTWTEEQRRVIDLRHRNILVSAAAGSGKTAVLVERILAMVTDETDPVDIDRLLIVTFTRAAAAEMRERIRLAIEKRLEAEPENEHLQRQSTLIHHAQINTIDGFCAYVIRNYFHVIDLDPGYRTADEGELRLLKGDVLKDVLEEAYARGEEGFHKFVEAYATGKNDTGLEEQILSLYEYSMSYPWPKEWLESCRKLYEANCVEELTDTPWMQSLDREAARILADAEEMTQENLKTCDLEDGPVMYREAILDDLGIIDSLCRADSFDKRVELLQKMKFARLSGKKMEGVSDAAKEQVKDGRAQVKDMLTTLKETYYFQTLDKILLSMQQCRSLVDVLVNLTLEFADAFAARKRDKNLLDFADMEHFALEILTKKEEGELYSQAARDLSEQFREIFIDEYQDSNLVQETILTAVSRIPVGEYNLFMVGDVKQSIYRFRMARPELFMEKFHSYSTTDSKTQRIDLHKNFRSRPEVLSGVNYIFKQIMGEDLGKVEYDADAALYPGAIFPEGGKEGFPGTEILLVEKNQEYLGSGRTRDTQELEAMAVAGRILDMVGSEQVLDKETGNYRPVRYGDIVILLRTMAGWSEAFSQVLTEQGIPSYCASKTGYFSAQEVVTVLNYLHILDNPHQDIPFGAVLRSPICGLSVQEMAQIRLMDGREDYVSCVGLYLENGEDKRLVSKLELFMKQYQALRELVPYTPIHELIIQILNRTEYDMFAAAMPAGEQREANLRMLVEKAVEYEQTSYRGLFNFIRYIEHLQKYDVDFGEVNISAGDNLVQIMSIHKSKGLEFPVVFVSGMSKQFNQQDINASLIIHPDLGVGTDCIHPEMRIKEPVLAKQVLRQEIKLENLGEELRVLYVAMTRAKEKLILTGAVDKLERKVNGYQRLTRRPEEKLPYAALEKARCYFDWVLPAMARHSSFRWLYEQYDLGFNGLHPLYLENVPIKIQVVNPWNLVDREIEKQVAGALAKEVLLQWDTTAVYDEPLREIFQERFSYMYPYKAQADIPVKVSVSELKKQQQGNEDSYEMYFEPDVIPLVPEFVTQTEEVYAGPKRGTAYHRFMECLELQRASTEEQLAAQLEKLQEQGKMDEKMAECIDLKDILAFVNSSLGQRMAAAQLSGTLHKEQPFVISQQASTMKERWGDEATVLVQGIIDVYFEEEDGIVLADYKTDKVHRGEELVEHYHVQLDYYAKALERLTGKKVKEKIIYSFTLREEIRL